MVVFRFSNIELIVLFYATIGGIVVFYEYPKLLTKKIKKIKLIDVLLLVIFMPIVFVYALADIISNI